MPSPPSLHIKPYNPLPFPPISLSLNTITMSNNATTLSTISSLSSSIVDDPSHPLSTRLEAGWGSPSPLPDSFPPVSLATMATPIHSVTIPLYAHTLRDDFPNACNIKKLSDYLRSPAFTLSIDSFLTLVPLYMLLNALTSKTPISTSCPPTSPLPLNRPSYLASFKKYTLKSKGLWSWQCTNWVCWSF